MPKDPTSEFSTPAAAAAVSTPHDAHVGGGGFFGHPRGLATLFFTEMWERFSFYGMRALLVLFMTAAVAGTNPGMGLDTAQATAIYGLYTFFVYVLALPGGWIADNLWGQRKSVFVGGCIIAAGHFTMAIPTNAAFFVGLLLVVIGTGLLKPNVSTMVGDLYPEGGARRDAGFSIFYMGINIGAFFGPILCGALAEGFRVGGFGTDGNWHWGFSLAGIGMVIGLIQYALGTRHLGGAGEYRGGSDARTLATRSRITYAAGALFVAVMLVVGFWVAGGGAPFSVESLAGSLGIVTVVLALGFFAFVIVAGGHTPLERKRVGVIVWLFVLSALFWSGFEQAGSSLNLFAADLTDRSFGGWEMPASWLQSVNSLFIILLAPVFGFAWTWLAARNANPSIPVKFGLGLIGLAVGFFVLSWGAANASPTSPVSPAWLVVTYFFHTAGELMLSPVGLSSITKLSPPSRVGQMMGMWFVSVSLGNLIAGLVAGQLETLAPASLFSTVALIVGGGGLVALLLAPPVRRLIGDVD
jgi:POT family proton-dependent oligopeptide transporter